MQETRPETPRFEPLETGPAGSEPQAEGRRTFDIAYLCFRSPDDMSYWSSIPYWTVRKLRARGHKVTPYVFDKRLLRAPLWPIEKALSAMGRIWMPERSALFAAALRTWIAATLPQDKHDLIFCESSIQAACTPPGKPVFFWTDAEIDTYLQTYWPAEKRARVVNLKSAMALEQRGFDRASAAFYASKWAIANVTERYEVPAEKLVLAPFAENMTIDITDEAVQAAAQERGTARCDLLFIGVDWKRKGGDAALAIARGLNARGVSSTLHVVGCTEFAENDAPPEVRQHGFLNKSDPAELAKLERLFADCHFLVLASEAEALGIVLLEANAHGLPDIATRVGGIPTAVEDGVNGLLFDLGSDPDAVAGRVADLMAEPGRYLEMSRASRRRFVEEFSWDRRVAQFEDVFAQFAG
jgi:glycosyltransferase involved in cell wall biosynthesis